MFVSQNGHPVVDAPQPTPAQPPAAAQQQLVYYNGVPPVDPQQQMMPPLPQQQQPYFVPADAAQPYMFMMPGGMPAMMMPQMWGGVAAQPPNGYMMTPDGRAVPHPGLAASGQVTPYTYNAAAPHPGQELQSMANPGANWPETYAGPNPFPPPMQSPAFARKFDHLPRKAGGLDLHMSSSNATGYKGVVKKNQQGSRYKAYRKKNGKQCYLGNFPSAVEAAICFARDVLSEPEKTSQAASAQNHDAAAAAAAAAAGADPSLTSSLTSSSSTTPATSSAPPAALQPWQYTSGPLPTHFGGYDLHMSSTSATGYKGVVRHGSVFKAQRKKAGQQVYLGRFDSAVEAAACFARDVAKDRMMTESMLAGLPGQHSLPLTVSSEHLPHPFAPAPFGAPEMQQPAHILSAAMAEARMRAAGANGVHAGAPPPPTGGSGTGSEENWEDVDDGVGNAPGSGRSDARQSAAAVMMGLHDAFVGRGEQDADTAAERGSERDGEGAADNGQPLATATPPSLVPVEASAEATSEAAGQGAEQGAEPDAKQDAGQDAEQDAEQPTESGGAEVKTEGV